MEIITNSSMIDNYNIIYVDRIKYSIPYNTSFLTIREIVAANIKCDASDFVIVNLEMKNSINLEETIESLNLQTKPNYYTIKYVFSDEQIFVKLLNGKTINITVSSHNIIKDVKQILFIREGIPIDKQRFHFNGKNVRK